jgi:hypothetical protein
VSLLADGRYEYSQEQWTKFWQVLNPKPKRASCATRAVFGPPTHPPRARREGAPGLASQWVNRGAVLVSAFLSPHDATAIMEMDRDWGATYSSALACGVNKALQG